MIDRIYPTLDEFVRKCEKFKIKMAIKRHQTLTGAAKELNISMTTLWRKMKKYQITVEAK